MKKRMMSVVMAAVLLLGGCAGRDHDVSRQAHTPETEASQGEDEGGISERTEEEGTETRKYTWQEITVTLPEGWEDSCRIVTYKDGFSIYQKASYEEDNGLGFICGIERTKDILNYGAGETLFAYTDDGLLYYLICPTDVPCDTNNEAVLDEYLKLCAHTTEVKASVEIAAQGVHMDAEEYVLPTSSIRALDQDSLMYLSDNDLWLARNEIYARHGRQFANEYLQKYFDRCSWYDGTTPADQFQDNTLSQLEMDNLSILTAAEQEYDARHPYPKKYAATETAAEELSGDGISRRISYQVTEQKNGRPQCCVTVDGETYVVSELTYMTDPVADMFYITDISEDDGMLEIAVLDYGPSDDPITYFFRYEDTLSYIGQVPGFPFAELNHGINGFNGMGGITGRLRMDLIETAYLEGYWWYDQEDNWIKWQNTGWYHMPPAGGHTLYEELPVYYERDEASGTTIIPAQEVYFLGSDMWEWILVRGKDGSQGYMHVEDGNVVELNKPAEEVFSDLYYFD